jgi:hypothetical protein
MNTFGDASGEVFKHYLDSYAIMFFLTQRNSDFKMGIWINLYLNKVTNESGNGLNVECYSGLHSSIQK